MINKLVVIINSLKVPKIKKILLYEMKFLVPNYSCLQNPWLWGYRPQIPVLSALCPQLNLLNPLPPKKIPGYATADWNAMLSRWTSSSRCSSFIRRVKHSFCTAPSWRWRRHIPPKRQALPTHQHIVTYQNLLPRDVSSSWCRNGSLGILKLKKWHTLLHLIKWHVHVSRCWSDHSDATDKPAKAPHLFHSPSFLMQVWSLVIMQMLHNAHHLSSHRQHVSGVHLKSTPPTSKVKGWSVGWEHRLQLLLAKRWIGPSACSYVMQSAGPEHAAGTVDLAYLLQRAESFLRS